MFYMVNGFPGKIPKCLSVHPTPHLSMGLAENHKLVMQLILSSWEHECKFQYIHATDYCVAH